ncbi:MAG: hypothetical protein ACOYXC_06600 [Candidatus Rifleibacteriota bacterium]
MLKEIVTGLFFSFFVTAGLTADSDRIASAPPQIQESNMEEINVLQPMANQPKYLLKKQVVPHCKRGPHRCEICRDSNEAKWCLLDVDPPDQDKVQRPVVEFSHAGEKFFKVFDLLKVFADRAEAEKYCRDNDLERLVVIDESADDH